MRVRVHVRVHVRVCVRVRARARVRVRVCAGGVGGRTSRHARNADGGQGRSDRRGAHEA